MRIRLRWPIGPEKQVVTAWVGAHCGPGWASEAEVAFGDRPRSCSSLSVITNCSASPATTPPDLGHSARSQGLDAALLLVTLRAKREHGYAYAGISAVGRIEFYQRTVGGIVIPGSWPGL